MVHSLDTFFCNQRFTASGTNTPTFYTALNIFDLSYDTVFQCNG